MMLHLAITFEQSYMVGYGVIRRKQYCYVSASRLKDT